MAYGPRFEKALVYAARLHRDQSRKVSDVPYVTHLLAVAALVGEDGGGEAEAIAALLHDAVEDQGGLPTLREIRRRFGRRVAGIVRGCTDATVVPKPPWRARKKAYLAHLAGAPPEVLRVSCADKVHNARSVVAELRRRGSALWAKFNGGRDGTLWYYRTLVRTYRRRRGAPRRMVEELARTVREMERLA